MLSLPGEQQGEADGRHAATVAGAPADPPRSLSGATAIRLVLLAAFGLLLAASVARTPTTVFSMDATKWSFAGAVFGTGHATGYPLYSLLNGLWAVPLTPFASPATAAGLLDVACVLGSAVLLHRLVRLRGLDPLVADLTVLVLLSLAVVWQTSVTATVAPLALLLLLAVLVALAAFDRQPSARRLALVVLLISLATAHHGTAIFLPVVLLPFVRPVLRICRRPRHLLMLAGAALVGPLLYLYLPIVTALDRPYLENAVTSLGDLVAVVRGAQFATATGNFTRAADLLRTLVEWITGEFGLLLVLAALGTVVLAARRHLAGARVELSLLLYAATVVVFALQYPDSDPLNRMKHFLSLVVLVLLLLAHGLQALRDRAPDRRWALGGAAAVAVLVVAFLLVPSVRDSRRAVADTSSAASALAALEAVPPGTVIVTGDYDASSFLWYYLIGEGRFADKELQVAHHWRLTQVLDHLRGTGEDPLRADPPGTYRYHVGDDILAAHPPVEEGRPVYVYGIALPETPEIVATQVGDKLWRLSLPPPAG